MHLMGDYLLPAAPLASGQQLAHPIAILAVTMFASLALPAAARAADAECGVTDSGIPDGVFSPIDVAHIRKSLADVGIGLGGSYVGEGFTNTGGIKQGAQYDSVLTLYLVRLEENGAVEGPLLVRQRLPDPWQQHHRR